MMQSTHVDLARLEQLLARKKWSTSDLAKHSGLKYNTVYSLRKGRRVNHSAQTLMAIAQSFGVSVDYLLGKTDEDEIVDIAQQLADIVMRLNETRREELMRVAQALEMIDMQRRDELPPDETMATLLEVARQFEKLGRTDELERALRALLQTR